METKIRGVGALLGALSGTFYAISGALAKLSTSLKPLTITWFRSLSISFLSCLVIIASKEKFWTYERKDYLILASIGVLGAAVNGLQFYAFFMIYLSDSITLISTAPVFIVFINCFMKKEMIRLADALLIVFCLSGIIFCTQPHFIFQSSAIDNSSNNPWGYVLSLIVALLSGILFTLIKRIEHLNVFSSVFLENIVTSMTLTPFMASSEYFSMPDNALDVVYLACLCLCSFFAFVLAYFSIIIDNPFMAAIGRTSDIVVSHFLNFFLFSAPLNGFSVFGSVLVMLSVIAPSVLNYVIQKNQLNQT